MEKRRAVFPAHLFAVADMTNHDAKVFLGNRIASEIAVTFDDYGFAATINDAVGNPLIIKTHKNNVTYMCFLLVKRYNALIARA